MTDMLFNNGLSSGINSKFRLEAFRSNKGLTLVFSGIIGVGQFDCETVLLKSHVARVEIKGKRLNMTVFENNDIEIIGKVEGISFVYGKN